MVPKEAAITEPRSIRGPRWRPIVYAAWSLPPQLGRNEAKLALAEEILTDAIEQELFTIPGLNRSLPDQYVGCYHIPGKLAWQERCFVDIPNGVDPGAVAKAIK